MDNRFLLLQQWLTEQLHPEPLNIIPLAGDASFRQYFRVQTRSQSYIAMDAPPDVEDTQPFIAINQALQGLQVQTPKIIVQDTRLGFLLLSDFGDQLLLRELSPDTADRLYGLALTSLNRIQSCQQVQDFSLPTFGEKMILREFSLFVEWFLQRHLQLDLTASDHQLLQQTYEQLLQSADAQPKIFVHRDYHSRNIMCLNDGTLGILDFQDAVWGPVSYDAVSLLRDCYVDWPQAKVDTWRVQSFQLLKENHQFKASAQQYEQWFDWMGLQRHLKALFIFTRLNYLYEKPNYMQYLPRTLNYVFTVTRKYPEFAKFYQWLEQRITTKTLESVT